MQIMAMFYIHYHYPETYGTRTEPINKRIHASQHAGVHSVLFIMQMLWLKDYYKWFAFWFSDMTFIIASERVCVSV